MHPPADSPYSHGGDSTATALNIYYAHGIVRSLYSRGLIEAPWIEEYEGGINNPAFSIHLALDQTSPDIPTARASMDIYDFTGATFWQPALGLSLEEAIFIIGHEYRHLEPRNMNYWKLGGYETNPARRREWRSRSQSDADEFGNYVLDIYRENK